jgi:predicted ATPase
MKDNLQKSKELLEQASKLLPRDFTLSSARAYLNRAITEVAAAEGRRHRREQQEKQKEVPFVPPMTAAEQKSALSNLESLIAAEEKKLKALSEKKTNRGSGGSQMLNG